MPDKNKGGRPRKEIDYDQLDKLCAIQCTGEECAAMLDMDYDTLNNGLKKDGNKGFSEYFSKKSVNGKVSLRRRQYQKAMDGDNTMMIWLGKQHLNQSDKAETKTTGTVDQTLQLEWVDPPERD